MGCHGMTMQNLVAIARIMVGGDKGLLAMDESIATCKSSVQS